MILFYFECEGVCDVSTFIDRLILNYNYKYCSDYLRNSVEGIDVSNHRLQFLILNYISESEYCNDYSCTSCERNLCEQPLASASSMTLQQMQWNNPKLLHYTV